MDLAELIAAFGQSETALIRVDRGDDTAWAAVLEAVNTPVDIVGSGHPEDFVIPNYTVVDHDTYDGASVEKLIAALAAANHQGGYALLADSMTMTEAAASREVTLAYVDLWSADTEDDEDTGRAFRCAIAEVAAIEANLSIANMDFSDFADYADEHGGVFRGFDPGD